MIKYEVQCFIHKGNWKKVDIIYSTSDYEACCEADSNIVEQLYAYVFSPLRLVRYYDDNDFTIIESWD